jgi:hypothetical protein
MPVTLSCAISKIATIPNKVNADMIAEYRKYMCTNGHERHIPFEENRLHKNFGIEYERYKGSVRRWL